MGFCSAMSKKKSKTQKKKFFSDPKNKNKVFKKKKKVHEVVAKVDVALRKRGAFVVLPTSECKEIPHCSHGMMLGIGRAICLIFPFIKLLEV